MADACTTERMFMLVGVSRRDLLGFLLFLYFYFLREGMFGFIIFKAHITAKSVWLLVDLRSSSCLDVALQPMLCGAGVVLGC